MNENSALKTIHGLNIFRMALVIMLPLSALLTPKDPSVYLSKWGIVAVILYILGCLSIFYGDFLRAKWKLFDNEYIKENNIANWLFATGIIGYLIVCILVKDQFDPFRKSIFCKKEHSVLAHTRAESTKS